MSVVVELALLLSRSVKPRQLPSRIFGFETSTLLPARLAALNFSRFLPNKSIGLNILAITSGVAFLAFSLSIYDGYRGKVERIIFSLTPHVMVRPGAKLARDDADATDEKAACLKVCRAPFSVHTPDSATEGASAEFDARKVQAVAGWLAANAPRGTSASRVLFEEAKLEVRSKVFSTGGLRVMRLLGLESLYGNQPAPRIDLTFSDNAVRDRFQRGQGILISDALADEILKADGTPVVPGQSSIQIGSPDHIRSVQIAGIHRLGIHTISRNLIILPYAMAAEMLGAKAAAGPTYVGLTLANPDGARDVGNELRRGLRSEQLAAVPWQSVTDLFDQLELYRWIIFVTLSLSILVTAINTFVNINILIMERVQQIGIMRAMGLGPSQLLSIFVGVGFFQSVVGATLGYGLGILIGYMLDDYINSLVRDFIPITDAKIVPDAGTYASVLLFVALVSVVACLLAGRRTLHSAISKNLRGA
jgi:ABC-type lipoprotein release transport system permease subunit